MGLMNAFEIGKAGVNVHGKRIEIAATNVANIETPNYVRKIPLIYATENVSFAGVMNSMRDTMFSLGSVPYTTGGVAMRGVVEDPTLGQRLYKPGHPDADENGYIRVSNVNPMVEIADANLARRAYEANTAILTITKAMGQRAIEIGRT